MKDYKQYEISFPEEYYKELVNDISKIMEIDIDYDLILKAMDNDGEVDKKVISLFRDERDPESFLLLNCRNTGFLYVIVVRCHSDKHEEVKSKLLEWDSIAKKKYKDKPRKELKDYLLDSENSYLPLYKERYDFEL